MKRMVLWLGGILLLLIALLVVTTEVASAQDCTPGSACNWSARTAEGRNILYPFDKCECVKKETHYGNPYEPFSPVWETPVYWSFHELSSADSWFRIDKNGASYICYDRDSETEDCDNNRGYVTFTSERNASYQLRSWLVGLDIAPRGTVIYWEGQKVDNDQDDDICQDAKEYYQVGDSKDGALEFAGDQDWHLLSVSSEKTELIITVTIDRGRDYELELRSDDCQTVLYKSDGLETEPNGHPNENNTAETFTLWNVAPNTKYRVHIYEYGSGESLNDSGGYTVITDYGDTDNTAPSCDVAKVPDSSPEQYTYTIQDTGSGLAEIFVTNMWNVTLTPPENDAMLITDFDAGTTDTLIVTETQLDTQYGGISDLRVTDRAGNVRYCDPPLYLPVIAR